MKARVIATGDIVDATYWHTAGDGVKYYDIDKSGYTMMEDELDFDFSYTPDYWERLKHQYVGQAMQGLMTILPNIGGIEGRTPKQEIVDMAIDVATALVEKLKNSDV